MVDKYGKVKREDSMRIVEVYVLGKKKLFIVCYLDSGCSDHVFIVRTGGKNLRGVDKVNLKGVADQILKVEYVGEWDIIGEAYVYNGGHVNLISVPTLDKMGMKTVFGDRKCTVTDRYGKVVLKGEMDDTGLYRVDLEISDTIVVNNGDIRGISDQIVEGEHYMTPETIKRAKGARRMHRRCGHIGDDALGEAFDSGCYNACIYTIRDLINAKKLFGNRTACEEAKMKSPDEPTHEGPIPPYPGHTLIGDLKDFPQPT